MKQATITIQNTQYTIKQSFRALMDFERVSGKNSYAVNASLTDSLTMFYSMLTANNDTFTMSLNEFLSCLDEDSTILPEFHKYLASLVEPEKAVTTKKKAETR